MVVPPRYRVVARAPHPAAPAACPSDDAFGRSARHQESEPKHMPGPEEPAHGPQGRSDLVGGPHGGRLVPCRHPAPFAHILQLSGTRPGTAPAVGITDGHSRPDDSAVRRRPGELTRRHA